LAGRVEMILKLGGSAICDKAKPKTPLPNEIRRLAEEISKAGVKRLILLHGGGSYGHVVADQYKIADGYQGSSQLIGFARTRLAMMELNRTVLESLLDQGVPAVSISPSSFVTTENGRIRQLFLDPIIMALELGAVPLLFGDAVFDTKKGFAIVSADQLAGRLAIDLKADRVIMGVDVDGIMADDHHRTGRQELLKVVSASDMMTASMHIHEPTGVDVTGGFRGKLSEMTPVAQSGIEVLFVNARVPGRIYRALRKEETVGTILTK
jgi:isopentenyl phosphate kinase